MSQEVALPNPLGTERVGKLMRRFAIPSIISLVVNALYNMVDQVFIGQGIGYLGNAATNVIMPMVVMTMALGLMVGDGAAAFMSLNLGRKKQETAAHGVGNAVMLSLGISLVLMTLCLIFLEPLCHLFGATEDNLPYALDYGWIIILGFPLSAVSMSFAGFIRADGRPRASMTGLLLGCITNMILDPLFIFVFHWGMEGAALATIIGQGLNAAYYVFCMFSFRTIRLRKRHFRPHPVILVRTMTLGLSSFFNQVAHVFVMGIFNNALVYYGSLSPYGPDIPLAALGITMKVSMLASSIALGIASGTQPIWGYNYGSKQYDRVKEAYRLGLLSSTLVLLVAFAVFQLFPEKIILIFGQESDLYMAYAVKCFRIFLFCCFLVPLSGITAIFFQAIGWPMLALIISLLRQVIILTPSLLILGALRGIDGLLFAGPIADALSGVVSLILLRLFWKKIFADR